MLTRETPCFARDRDHLDRMALPHAKLPQLDTALSRRIEPRAQVSLRLLEAPGHPSTFCRARDVSAGGLAVDLGLPQPAGSRTKVRFALPDGGNEIIVTCSVLPNGPGSDPLGAHVAFVDLGLADRRRIRRFVVRWVEATKIEEALRA